MRTTLALILGAVGMLVACGTTDPKPTQGKVQHQSVSEVDVDELLRSTEVPDADFLLQAFLSDSHVLEFLSRNPDAPVFVLPLMKPSSSDVMFMNCDGNRVIKYRPLTKAETRAPHLEVVFSPVVSRGSNRAKSVSVSTFVEGETSPTIWYSHATWQDARWDVKFTGPFQTYL